MPLGYRAVLALTTLSLLAFLLLAFVSCGSSNQEIEPSSSADVIGEVVSEKTAAATEALAEHGQPVAAEPSSDLYGAIARPLGASEVNLACRRLFPVGSRRYAALARKACFSKRG